MLGETGLIIQVQNLNVVGSNPAPATNLGPKTLVLGPILLGFFTIPPFGKTPCNTAGTAKKGGLF